MSVGAHKWQAWIQDTKIKLQTLLSVGESVAKTHPGTLPSAQSRHSVLPIKLSQRSLVAPCFVSSCFSFSIRIQDAKCKFHLQHSSSTVDNTTQKEMRKTKRETWEAACHSATFECMPTISQAIRSSPVPWISDVNHLGKKRQGCFLLCEQDIKVIAYTAVL